MLGLRCVDYRLIKINAMMVKAIATLFFRLMVSLNNTNPPIVINTILPALYIGKTTDVFNVSKARIKKYDENRFGIPTKKPVKTSLFLTSPCFL